MIPKILLSLVLALLPSYLIRFNIGPLPTTLLELLLVVFLFVVFITHFKQLSTLKNLGPINLFIGLFVIAGIISTFVSPEFSKAAGQLKAFIIEPVLFFYAAVLVIGRPSDLKMPLYFLLGSATLISLFAIVQHWTLIFVPLRFWGYGEGVARVTSVFEYPNALALYLAPLLGLFFVLWQKKTSLINTTLLGYGSLIIFIALFFTYSRGALLAIILALVFLSIRRYSLQVAIPAILILVVLTAVFLPSIRDRFTLSDDSNGARVSLYKVGVAEVLQSPLIGNGLYGFRTTLEQSNFQGEILNYPHNIFLNFWLEMGLLGLISFCLIFNLSLSKYGSDPSTINLAVAIFLFIILIHGLVDVPYFKNDLSILFWFAIALLYTPQISETKTAH